MFDLIFLSDETGSVALSRDSAMSVLTTSAISTHSKGTNLKKIFDFFVYFFVVVNLHSYKTLHF